MSSKLDLAASLRTLTLLFRYHLSWIVPHWSEKNRERKGGI